MHLGTYLSNIGIVAVLLTSIVIPVRSRYASPAIYRVSLGWSTLALYIAVCLCILFVYHSDVEAITIGTLFIGLPGSAIGAALADGVFDVPARMDMDTWHILLFVINLMSIMLNTWFAFALGKRLPVLWTRSA